ncbi:MAG: hypothetical protein ACPGQS_00270 [Bradymonadia bacterium]
MLQGKQNAWVFGASGLTGREVVNALRIAGVATHAHLRPNSSSASHVIPIFEKIGADVQTFEWHADAIHQAFEENAPTVVFLTLGTTRSKAKVDGQGHRAVDYRLTKMVLDVIRSDHLSTEIIYLSAVRGLGASLSDYFKIRCELEAELAAFDNPVMIAQPALITGDRLDSRPWERRAALATNMGLDLLASMGLKAIDRRYRSVSGQTLGCGLVQLWLEQVHHGVVNVDALIGAARRFNASFIDT